MNFPARRIPLAFMMVALAAFSASPPFAKAQPTNDYPILRINEPLTRSLTGSESHTYRLHASARHLVKVTVLQKGVNVSVQAFDSQQKRLANADDSLGRVGPQDLEFLTEVEGDYSIRVIARAEEIGGQYEIFVTARDVTPEDRIRITARAHVSAGNSDD